jgi:hypothetical protein
MHRNGTRGRTWSGIGGPAAAPVASPVRHFHCSSTQVAEIERLIGQSFTPAQVRGTISASAGEAAYLARQAGAKLRSKPTGNLEPLFVECFGVRPAYVPAWRPGGQKWNVGGVVRARYESAAKILLGGSIHYSCLGWPWKIGRVDDPATYRARLRAGMYRMGLGAKLWTDWKAVGSVTPVAAILGGALIIYFGPLLTSRAGVAKTVSVYGYLRFALAANDIEPPAWVRTPGADLPPPAPATQTTGPSSGSRAPPVRLRLTDEELERILGGKPADPLAARIDWIIQQVPPTRAARPPLKDLLRKKFDESLDRAMERTGVPKRLRPYVRKAAHGAIEKGSKLVIEESLNQMGVTAPEAVEAIRGAIERVGQESP